MWKNIDPMCFQVLNSGPPEREEQGTAFKLSVYKDNLGLHTANFILC